MHVCGKGHELRGPADRLTNGQCRECHRADLRAYNKRRTEGLALLRDVEQRATTIRSTM